MNKQIQVLFASSNNHKYREMRSLTNCSQDIELISFKDLAKDCSPPVWIENGGSFRANALIKAKSFYRTFGKPVLADDSGICVNILGNQPGVESAYYAGPNALDAEHRQKLLKDLADVPRHLRNAHFHCTLCFYINEHKYFFFDAQCHGMILYFEYGNDGFGYDPIFFSNDLQKSFGEASQMEKNQYSHRSKAVAQLLSFLRASAL